jgi:hypothetical protein
MINQPHAWEPDHLRIRWVADAAASFKLCTATVVSGGALIAYGLHAAETPLPFFAKLNCRHAIDSVHRRYR